MVGRTTWNKLYEVYNDIANRLLTASLRPSEYPGIAPGQHRNGDGAGAAVLPLPDERLREQHPAVSIDGSFGAATENSVRATTSALRS